MAVNIASVSVYNTDFYSKLGFPLMEAIDGLPLMGRNLFINIGDREKCVPINASE